MEYFIASWQHESADEPVLFYSELNEERYELRKVEIYKGNRFGMASAEFEMGGASLGESPVPSIEEINESPEFSAQIITREEFEEVWVRYTELVKQTPDNTQST